MRAARPTVIALSDNPCASHNDRPDHGVRARTAPALRRQAKSQRHVLLVTIGLTHRFLRADRLRDLATVRVVFRLEWVLAFAAGLAFLLSSSANAA